MTQAALTNILREIKTLEPEELRLVELAVQSQLRDSDNDGLSVPPTPETENAWEILEALTGTIEAPLDWSEEHDHYLSGAPKRHYGNSL